MRRQQRDDGLTAPTPIHPPSNRKSHFKSPEQGERDTPGCGERVDWDPAPEMLPVLLRRLGKIPEPRNPKKLKHQLTVLMLYGMLVFVFQYGSRRAAHNGEITRPMFEHNLRLLFPQLESLPHSDTLFRLLCRIDVGQIEAGPTSSC